MNAYLEEYFELCKLMCRNAVEYFKNDCRCRGMVIVRVDYNVMNIEIQKGTFVFNYKIEDFMEKCHNGDDFKQYYNDCISVYKAAILKAFFYNEEKDTFGMESE